MERYALHITRITILIFCSCPENNLLTIFVVVVCCTYHNQVRVCIILSADVLLLWHNVFIYFLYDFIIDHHNSPRSSYYNIIQKDFVDFIRPISFIFIFLLVSPIYKIQLPPSFSRCCFCLFIYAFCCPLILLFFFLLCSIL